MAVSLREDFDASRLRGLAKKAKDGLRTLPEIRKCSFSLYQ
jgi:hypothetical protein